MLDYVLKENLLTEAPDDFRAQVVNVKSRTQSDIIDRILHIGAGLAPTNSELLTWRKLHCRNFRAQYRIRYWLLNI
jgi:hypothetical protein